MEDTFLKVLNSYILFGLVSDSALSRRHSEIPELRNRPETMAGLKENPLTVYIGKLEIRKWILKKLKQFVFRSQNFSIVNLEHLISIFYVGTFKFDNKCLLSQFKVSLQDMTTTGFPRGIKLIRKMEINAWSRDLKHKSFDFKK